MDEILLEHTGFQSLQSYLAEVRFSALAVLVDENTYRYCYPLLKPALPAHILLQTRSGEQHKNLSACETIWQSLTDIAADRQALLLNLGGGMLCDMGAFAAGCYKRGIRFVHLPTTLLAMVDAAIGGKCGIDFMGCKNHLGLFQKPERVFIHPQFLRSLPLRQLHAGFAEVIKHYLIADEVSFRQLAAQPLSLEDLISSPEAIEDCLLKNSRIKQQIVARDPQEMNARKALNFGHTIGHAVESFYLNSEENQLLHGEAVGIGIIAESYISMRQGLIAESDLLPIVETVCRYFRYRQIDVGDFDRIIEFIQQDKKNEQGENRFTLLRGIGNFIIRQTVKREMIFESLRYFNSCCG